MESSAARIEDKLALQRKGTTFLKCTYCKGSLSIFPVYMYNDESFVCGRCPLDESSQPVRQLAYEYVSIQTKFQCQFKKYGCNEELFPDDLKLHEECCTYRPFECLPLCRWFGAECDVEDHFILKHPHLIFDDAVDLNIKQQLPGKLLIKCSNELFELRIMRTGQELKLSVAFVSLPVREFVCVISTVTETKTIKIWRRQAPTDSFACIGAQSNAVRVGIKEIKLPKVEDIVLNPDLEQNHDVILNLLECPICLESMVPPIMLCSTGHSTCSDCSLITTECGLCRQEYMQIRNFSLEAVTRTVRYYCRFQNCGKKLLGSDRKVEHERTCSYAPLNCIFCDHRDQLEEFRSHIKTNHSVQILKENSVRLVIDRDARNGPIARYYVIRLSCVFVFEYSKPDRNRHRFAMYRIDHFKHEDELDFILTFTSGKPDEIAKMIFRLPFNLSGVILSYSQIEKFMNGGMLPLRIDIVQKSKSMTVLL